MSDIIYSLRQELMDARTNARHAEDTQEEMLRRESFAAADKFLNTLADDFVALLRARVKHGQVQNVMVGTKEEVAVSFADKSLERVRFDQVRDMIGYRRLNDICARPEVDLCLGQPVMLKMGYGMGPLKAIHVFLDYPYSGSLDFWEKREKQRSQFVERRKRAR